jgi:asparagine synthase (glutamine-hydrolysing)
MLMANSVEGRFPFLDANVMALAASLPPAYKLRVLDEKHVLKKASQGLIPAAIVGRKKQPYRAPDALAFVGPEGQIKRPAWIADALSERAIADAGVFEAKAVTQLWRKCNEMSLAQLSNADNMAVVGILSTQLLHEHFVRACPTARPIRLRSLVDRAHEV